MSEPSRLRPYIRAVGMALTIPGTNIGPGILADIQDKLSADGRWRETSFQFREELSSRSGI